MNVPVSGAQWEVLFQGRSRDRCSGRWGGSRVVASSGERVSLEVGARDCAREITRKDAAGGTALCRRWLEAPTLPCD